jgi:hypothetical protein
MKRIIAIVLLCWSAGVMAEPIEMICKGVNDTSTNLTINLATNKVQYGEWKPLDIFFKNDKYIVWVGNHMDTDAKVGRYVKTIVLYSLDRQSGKLQSVAMYLDQDKAGWRSVRQCFRSF